MHNYIQEQSLWNFLLGEKIRLDGAVWSLYAERTTAYRRICCRWSWFGANTGSHGTMVSGRAGKIRRYFSWENKRFSGYSNALFTQVAKMGTGESQLSIGPGTFRAFRGNNTAEMNDVDKKCFYNVSEADRQIIKEQGLVNDQGNQWKGQVGFIGPLLRKYLSPDPNMTFYLCGPCTMTVTVIDSAANVTEF